MLNKIEKTDFQNFCWNSWCILSLIGIWPRFIEPHWLTQRSLTIPIPNLPIVLDGLTLVQISDLHWHQNFSKKFQRTIHKRVAKLRPDLIVFTGDFLSRSQLDNPKELTAFLCQFQARYGCYAVLGNHDYNHFVTVNQEGVYDIDQKETQSTLQKGFSRLIRSPTLLKKTRTAAAMNVQCHAKLKLLLQDTPFQLLENKTVSLNIHDSHLNLCGLGEFMTGHFDPNKAFTNYRSDFPGIILVHNPDALPALIKFPGELVLSGHTHGGQINLPWLRNKFTLMENPEWRSGLSQISGKWLFVNRGLGSVFPFRWFSPPEISHFTLKRLTDG